MKLKSENSPINLDNLSTIETIDINDHALRILNAAIETVDAILNKRKKMNWMPWQRTKTLFAFIGERHDNPAHHLHNMAITALLKQKNTPFALAMETPHNSFEKQFKNATYWSSIGLDRPSQSWETIKSYTQFNKLSALSKIFEHNYDLSRHTHVSLIRSCVDLNILPEFTDAARNVLIGDFLDYEDPSTLTSIEECMPNDANKSELILARDPEGVWIRNHHIRSLITATKQPILIQLCGNAHVAGMSTGQQIYKEEHSLMGLSLEAKQHFLGISMPLNEPAPCPLSAKLAKHHIQHKNLPMLNADYAKKTKAEQSSIQETEAAYVKAILTHPKWHALGLDQNILQSAQHQNQEKEVLAQNFREIYYGTRNDIEWPIQTHS